MIKLLIRTILALAGLVILVISVCLLAPNKTLRPLLTQQATQLLSTDVSIASLELCLSCNTLQFNKIIIESPEGFGNQPLLQITQATIELRLNQLYREPIFVDNIALSGVHVHYLKTGKRSNITSLLAQLPHQDFFSDEQPMQENTAHSAGQQKLLVDHLTLTDVTVSAHSPEIGSETLELKLPPLELFELGGKNGQPAGAIAAQVIARLQLELAAALIRNPAFRERIRQQAAQRLRLRASEN
ncbi:AsmA family protein [Sinobacterium caligoides]|nr:AsmA family protein [Sinobacterium caligoides]